MDEQMSSQLADAAARMAAAVEVMEKALARMATQQEAIEAKVERIVAAVEERSRGEEGAGLDPRLAQLERENQELKAQAQRAMRKTLPPMVSALLSKDGLDEGMRFEAGALDKTLASLSLEQRIAVKAEMARAGLIE